MKVYLAADHAGFELKTQLASFVRGELGYDVEDCGARAFVAHDDYPEIIAGAARLLARDAAQGIDSRAILIGGSGQGEAMVANRFPGVRAALFYGNPTALQTDSSGQELDIIASTRRHNNANALALGARFISTDEARNAVKEWLATAFFGEEQHRRRIQLIDHLAS